MTAETLYDIFLRSTGVSTDTRNITPKNLFFALSGPNFNANTFAQQALEKGAIAAVVDDPEVAIDHRYVVVDDCLKALQNLANEHRQHLKCPIIAICGSNGKTTSKELIAAVLSSHFDIFFTPGNFNNHIGVPLSLLQIKPNHEFGIIEMGANHKGEHDLLCKIATPDFGVITNNGKDHLEGFGSIEGVIAANNELFEYLRENNKTAFVNSDDSILMEHSSDLTRILYGSSPKANCQVQLKEPFPYTSVSVRFTNPPTTIDVQSQLFGSFQKDNIALASSIGDHFGVPQAKIKTALESYQPANMRTQRLEWKGNDILLDAYNANPSSMMAVLNDFAKSSLPNKGVILGDMLEMGDASDQEHGDLVTYLTQQDFVWVALVGVEFAKHRHTRFHYFDSAKDVRNYLLEQKISNHTLLIKGSRGLKLEEVIQE